MRKQPALKVLQDRELNRERELQHDLIRSLTLAERRASRLRLSLAERLSRALAESRTLTDGFASKTSETARRTPQSTPPRPVESIYDRYSRRFGLMIRNLEDEIDRTKLRAVNQGESREERVKRLLSSDYEGMSADEVSFIDPSLGTVLSIRRERHAAGRDHLGRRKSES